MSDKQSTILTGKLKEGFASARCIIRNSEIYKF